MKISPGNSPFGFPSAKIILMPVELEVAVQNPAGMRIAREIGAARIELTQALALGGLTPSRATIEFALEAGGEGGPEVHVLIRPVRATSTTTATSSRSWSATCAMRSPRGRTAW